jgi:D-alanine-D-alanine ligase
MEGRHFCPALCFLIDTPLLLSGIFYYCIFAVYIPNMSNNSSQESLKQYLTSKTFLKQVLFIAACVIGLLLLTQLWLRFYTHHGQKIVLPAFVGMEIDKAREIADDKSFEIIVNDSVFIVGKKGGLITDQNPKATTQVKEGRKVYVTITKFGTETVRVADLPTMYGNAFDQKKTELKYRDIECVIKDYVYDPGEPNHILEVWYNGELIMSRDGRKDEIEIKKGGTLECVVSRRDGGDVTVPDLRCLTVEEARFMLESSKLQLGDIAKKGTAEPDAVLYVVSQSPSYDGITNIKMGEKVSIGVSPVKPADCQ